MAKTSKRTTRKPHMAAERKGKRISASQKAHAIEAKRKQKARRERKQKNKRQYAQVSRMVAHDLAGPIAAEMRQVRDGDAEIVIEAIANGSTARGACRELGVHVGAVMVRIGKDPELYGHYARARESQAELWAEQIVSEADAPIVYDADGANVELGHVKHKADVRRWLMGKYHVRRFGDKVTAVIAGDAENPVETIHRNMTPEEAMASYALERARKGTA